MTTEDEDYGTLTEDGTEVRGNTTGGTAVFTVTAPEPEGEPETRCSKVDRLQWKVADLQEKVNGRPTYLGAVAIYVALRWLEWVLLS